MPPCAHTEWDRLTGTMENRSTCPPASATLTVAIKPARPPPTTITLSLAKSLNPLAEEVVADEAGHRPDAEAGHQDEGHRPHVGRHALRARTDGDSPVEEKRPHAVAQMERCRHDADDIQDEIDGVHENVAHQDAEFGDRHIAEGHLHPGFPRMPGNEHEGDDTGYTLQHEHVVAAVMVAAHVVLRDEHP